MFHCDLLSHDTSSTSLRPRQAEIEDDSETYSIDYISDVNIDNWPRRRGSYLQFLTHFVPFDTPEWMLLEQSQSPIFLDCEKWKFFSMGNDYLEFISKYRMRNIAVHK